MQPPCLHVFLDTPRDYASLAFFMHSKTLQAATLRLPLPLWRTPMAIGTCMGLRDPGKPCPTDILWRGFRGVQPPCLHNTQ